MQINHINQLTPLLSDPRVLLITDWDNVITQTNGDDFHHRPGSFEFFYNLNKPWFVATARPSNSTILDYQQMCEGFPPLRDNQFSIPKLGLFRNVAFCGQYKAEIVADLCSSLDYDRFVFVDNDRDQVLRVWELFPRKEIFIAVWYPQLIDLIL